LHQDTAKAIELTPKQKTLSLAAVIAAAYGIGLSFGVGLPLTALTFEAWSQPKWVIGLAGALPSLAILLVLPLVPRLVVRLGAIASILVGCLIGAAGFVALYLFDTVPAWIAARFIMSGALALPWLVGETWMNAVATEATRGRVIAIYAISFFLGFLTGPLVLDNAGLTGPIPFIAGAAGSALACLPIILAQRLAPDLTHTQSMSVVAALSLAPIAMVSGCLGGFAEMSYLSLIPNVGLAAGLDEGSALRLLSVLTLGGIVLQFPIGWLADKASRVGLTVALTALFIGLSLALPWALQSDVWPTIVAFLLGGVILGFYTLGLVIVGEKVAPANLAAANVAFLVMYQMGAIAGPIVSGAAMTLSPVYGFVTIVSSVMGVATLFLVWLSRRLTASA
jgi:MFS family permease